MADFDEAFFDSSFFDEAPTPHTRMAKVKLDLDNRDDDNLRSFAEGHRDAMAGNAHFPTPNPTALVYDGALDDFVDALGEVASAEAALKEVVRIKNEKRVILEGRISVRGTHVEQTSGGVESVIVSSALGVRDTPVPTTSLEKVMNLNASAGDNEGEIDLGWNGNIKGKRGFIVEMREDAVGMPWEVAKQGVTKSRCTVDGLTPGKRYFFRVRAFGPDEMVGPWSDEAQQRCP